MSARYEKTGDNTATIYFEIPPDEFENALTAAFYKTKDRIRIPGFRKGRATRQFVEARYGKDFYYNDAINIAIEPAYNGTIDEFLDEIRVVSQPEIELISASKEEGVNLSAKVFIEPITELDNYKGFTYWAPVLPVTDEDIDKEIENIREKNSRLVTVEDRVSAMDDNLLIDFTGYIDDEPIENADSKDFEIVIGSGGLVPGFEDQLIGHNTGDSFTVYITFPDEYIKEELQGRSAEFEVQVKEIRQRVYPDIDDEFAQDVSEFDTLLELKEDIREHLCERAEETAKNKRQDQVLKALSATFEIDIPQCMIDDEINERLNEIRARYGGYRLSLEQLASYQGTTKDAMMEELRERALKTCKLRVALIKIAELEGITVTYDEIIERINDRYSEMPEDKKQELIAQKLFIKTIEREMLVERALEQLMSYSIEKEPENEDENEEE